jgi:RimJ/RimL family protein N-acetyltransferase
MPRLETSRLLLLPMSFEILEARCESALALEQILGCAVPESFPLADTLRLSHKALGATVNDKKRAGDWGSYILIDRQRVVGLAGFKGSPSADDVELFYELIPEARGQGLATAAALELSRWALNNRAARITAKIEAANANSRRVLERCGFQALSDQQAAFEWYTLTPRAAIQPLP